MCHGMLHILPAQHNSGSAVKLKCAPARQPCTSGVCDGKAFLVQRSTRSVSPLCAPVTQAKLTQLSRLEERLDVKLAIAAELPGQFEGLARQQAAAESAVEVFRKDMSRYAGGRSCLPAAMHVPQSRLPAPCLWVTTVATSWMGASHHLCWTQADTSKCCRWCRPWLRSACSCS